MAGARQCSHQLARQEPAIQQWDRMPKLMKLDGYLDRRLLADCTYSLRRRKAAVGISCCLSNAGFVDFQGTHTIGHNQSVSNSAARSLIGLLHSETRHSAKANNSAKRKHTR